MEMQVSPEALSALSGKLCNVADDVDAEACEPPIPQAGEITDVVESALRMICEGIGNMSASAGGVGDAIAQGRDVYVKTDYEAAANLERTQINAEGHGADDG